MGSPMAWQVHIEQDGVVPQEVLEMATMYVSDLYASYGFFLADAIAIRELPWPLVAAGLGTSAIWFN